MLTKKIDCACCGFDLVLLCYLTSSRGVGIGGPQGPGPPLIF